MASDAKELLQPYLQKISVPRNGDKIFKSECVFSFDNPESETGLYICMKTFVGVGREHVERFSAKTGNCVFLHIQRQKHVVSKDKSEHEPEKKITRLAIGVEGGFQVDDGKKYEYEDTHTIVILPHFTQIKLPHPTGLYICMKTFVGGILSAQSADYLDEVQSLESTWDGEVRRVSKFAENLQQLDNGVKVLPSGWQCSQCDKKDNLWLNLTDGAVLCGRKFFDGTGGNNHALEHYEKTGYPLAVKLGTITGDGKADVYSYAEDDMVEDPYLKQHLAHFGINMEGMQKTDKSMAELEIDLNQRVGEWAAIQESGKSLVPLFGPGYTGLTNLGNSCYLNSVLQVVFTIPEFQQRYYQQANRIFDAATLDAYKDFNVQMAKLAVGILSGKYSQSVSVEEGEEAPFQFGIKPFMFKSLIGKGHPEFSTKRQQDAVEFLLHLINVMERHVRNLPSSPQSPAESFKFRVEERLQCMASGQVRYTYRPEYHLPVPVPLETASNLDEVRQYEKRKKEAETTGQSLKPEDMVRPKITLQSCLEALTRPEEVQNFYSTAINGRTTALKTTRLATFPDYLWIQLRKFTLAEDWTPKKLDVAVEVPQFLDLSWMKSSGQQSGEVLLSEQSSTSESESSEPQLDPTVIASLTEMGFPVEGCKRATYLTRGQGLEAATQCIMEHMDDPDFFQPFEMPKSSQTQQDSFTPNEEGIAMLQAMGFTRSQCIMALRNTNNNVERAADWIFCHPDEINSADSITAVRAPEGPQFRDGVPVYELAAFISHMGTSTNVGHYVCHIKKDDRWVIFNDEKVALSENPPMELGYLYMYRRVNQ
nr:EOG090X0181 [Cyclestheria hislopi]